MEDNNNKGGNGFVGILCFALAVSILGNIWLYINQHSFKFQISELEEKNEDYKSKFDQISEENKQLKADVQALEAQIAALNNQIEELNPSDPKSTASISESADISPELQEKLNDTDKITGSSGSSSSSGSSAYEQGRELANQASDYLESIDWDELQDEAERKGAEFAHFLNGLLN